MRSACGEKKGSERDPERARGARAAGWLWRPLALGRHCMICGTGLERLTGYNVQCKFPKNYVRRLGDAGRFRRAAGGRTAPCFLGHTCRPKKRVYKGLAPTPRVAKPSRTTPTTQRRVRVERESPPLSRHQQRGRAAANSRRRRAAVLPDSGDDYVCRTPTPARALRLHTCPVPACASHRSSPADPETCCLWYRVASSSRSTSCRASRLRACCRRPLRSGILVRSRTSSSSCSAHTCD